MSGPKSSAIKQHWLHKAAWDTDYVVAVVVSSLSCTQLFCDPMDCSPPGSSVHGISQAGILEWVAISSSRGSSQPKDWTHVSCIGRWILYHQATWEAQTLTIYTDNGQTMYMQLENSNPQTLQPPSRSQTSASTATSQAPHKWAMTAIFSNFCFSPF